VNGNKPSFSTQRGEGSKGERKKREREWLVTILDLCHFASLC
jgi:hypothetical protein